MFFRQSDKVMKIRTRIAVGSRDREPGVVGQVSFLHHQVVALELS